MVYTSCVQKKWYNFFFKMVYVTRTKEPPEYSKNEMISADLLREKDTYLHISHTNDTDYFLLKLVHVTGITVLLPPDYSRNKVGATHSR